jgi:ATP-dependent RNA helicase DeaD
MTTEPFADLPAPISHALVRRGFETLTPVQEAVVSARSAGRDLRISSQTGSGKTVAIGIGLADHFLERKAPKGRPPQGPRNGSGKAASPSALVVVPTRELAAQVREELHWLYAELPGVRVEVVTGGTSILMERRALSKGPSLIVGTPGRLLDHMRNNAIACDAIEHVILDEADQMLDMGFREELEAILELLPANRASHLVSATFPRGVLDLANRYQNDALRIEGTRLGEANADIQHIAYTIRRHETYAALVNVLLMAGEERCLLFVNRRVDATELAEKLAQDGFGAAPFSGELAQAQRTRTLAAFRNGTLPILVSTEVAARGIDVPGIASVIHVDPPREGDAYTHRSGRTGRAGQAGRSILFVTPSDLGRVRRMLQYAKVEVSWQPIPTAAKVDKALRKRARRALHEKLAEHTPDETQAMYAKTLLEDRDPVQVVATLLDLAKPVSARTAMNVAGFDPKTERAPRSRAGREENGRSGHRPNRAGERRPPNQSEGRFKRFFVSWGAESGATTGRLLSQVCRRGGIESHQVGPIEVAARVSFVSVAEEVAAGFEERARRPDKRDPGIVIKRAEEKRSGGPPAERPTLGPRTAARTSGERGRGRPFKGKRPGHKPGR